MRYSKTVEGVTIPFFFPDDAVVSALSYEPRPGDLFVATYPKCGTTWLQYVVYGIFHDGRPPADIRQFFSASPFLELFGVGAVETMTRPGTIKTHLPFNEKIFSTHAKYIYVARNPYDVCVSAYHQNQMIAMAKDEGIVIDEHVERFVSGHANYGCYLKDSLIPWYTRRHKDNVLFLTYEELHADINMQVKKIAEFLGPEYGKRVSKDPSLLQRVIDMTSKERMRPLFKDFILANMEFTVEQRMRRNASVPQELVDGLKILSNRPTKHEFVRRGSVGDYKNFLTENHKIMLEEWISVRTTGCDVMALWSSVGLS